MVELDVAQIGLNWGWVEVEGEYESDFGSIETGYKFTFRHLDADYQTQANVNGEYIGTRYSPNINWGNPDVKTGNYTIWNAVVDYDISKNFSTYLKLDNILNKDYQIVDGYATSQRAAFVGLKASF